MKLVGKPHKPLSVSVTQYPDDKHERDMQVLDAKFQRIRSVMTEIMDCKKENSFFLRSASVSKDLVSIANLCNQIFERRAMDERVNLEALTLTIAKEAEYHD